MPQIDLKKDRIHKTILSFILPFSNSLHYGAYTCEACKTFFRRSGEKHQSYVCCTRKNQCFPNEDNSFTCKACRYRKCVSEGMSKTNIKKGRYTKERHIDNKIIIKTKENNSRTLPYLPKNSNSHDMIIICNKLFQDCKNIQWELEISDLPQKLLAVRNAINKGFVTTEEYLEFYKVTGIELDQRRVFTNFFESFLEILFKKLILTIRKFPGFAELPQKDFIQLIFQIKSDLRMLQTIMYRSENINGSWIIDLNNDNVSIDSKSLANVSDFQIMKDYETVEVKMQEANLTPEETLFIVVLTITQASKKDVLYQIHQKFSLAFVHYLENYYGDNYLQRLKQLVDLVTDAKLNSYRLVKWMNCHQRYVNEVYDSILSKMLANDNSYQEALEFFEKLSL